MTNTDAPQAALSDHMSLADVRSHYRGVSKTWVYARVADGTLPPQYKIGSHAFWSRREIEEFDAKRRKAEAA